MTTVYAEQTVGALVAEQPNRSRLFEELGIDYCCGGKRPLREACAEKGLDAEAVAERLASIAPPALDDGTAALFSLTLTQLADDIEATHHAYLRRELPRLEALVSKVAEVHGKKEPRLERVLHTLNDFSAEIFAHLLKEERILFPAIRAIDGGSTGPIPRGMISHPIAVMESEHDAAGDALATMHRLTDGFTVPEWGCNTYRALLDGLKELESDTHAHIHKENNVLFPRALEAERKLAQ